MAQRKRTRRTQEEYSMPINDALALLLPQHVPQDGDTWTLFVREGTLELTLTQAPEALADATGGSR